MNMMKNMMTMKSHVFDVYCVFDVLMCTSDLARTSDVQRHSIGMVRFTNNLKRKNENYGDCDGCDDDENDNDDDIDDYDD